MTDEHIEQSYTADNRSTVKLSMLKAATVEITWDSLDVFATATLDEAILGELILRFLMVILTHF